MSGVGVQANSVDDGLDLMNIRVDDPAAKRLRHAAANAMHMMTYQTRIIDAVLSNNINLSPDRLRAAINQERAGIKTPDLNLSFRDASVDMLLQKLSNRRLEVGQPSGFKHPVFTQDSLTSSETRTYYDEGVCVKAGIIREIDGKRANICFVVVQDNPSLYAHIEEIMKQEREALREKEGVSKFKFFIYAPANANSRRDIFASLVKTKDKDDPVLVEHLDRMPRLIDAHAYRLFQSQSGDLDMPTHATQQIRRALAGPFVYPALTL